MLDMLALANSVCLLTLSPSDRHVRASLLCAWLIALCCAVLCCAVLWWMLDNMLALTLILTRIRFRASDFGQVAKINTPENNSCKIETGFSCGDGARVICFFARLIQQLGFWTKKKSNQRRLLLSPAPHRVDFARPWTQASKPTRTDSSLAAKRRAEALPVVFFSTKLPSPARMSCCSVCTLV